MNIRRYKETDLPQIQSLFQKVFKHERSDRAWKWKFSDTPEELNPWILVCEDGGEIIGHISLWVHDAYIDGKKNKIGLRVDTMVDPDARGKGVYQKLNNLLLEEAKKDGIAFLYGFPAPKAKELFIKYTDASHLLNVPRYVRIQKPISLLASKVKPLKIAKPLDKLFSVVRAPKYKFNLESREINKCGGDFDELAERCRSLSKALLVRNASYLNWRFVNHPEKDYKIQAIFEAGQMKGYIVTCQVRKNNMLSGLIVDWLAESEDKYWEELLGLALAELKDADIVQTWVLPDTISEKVLQKGGLTHKDSPMPLVGKELNDETIPLRKYENWYITPGDVDSF
ncbi:GNAT family N-acetyltransferase [Sutcliffiella horikoshii]|uniref:GNAT family N-acetyltransferase n=1 Tax=Sutcliffiella horikoshii TaxID=79883 RepID=UPI003CF19C8E